MQNSTEDFDHWFILIEAGKKRERKEERKRGTMQMRDGQTERKTETEIVIL